MSAKSKNGRKLAISEFWWPPFVENPETSDNSGSSRTVRENFATLGGLCVGLGTKLYAHSPAYCLRA